MPSRKPHAPRGSDQPRRILLYFYEFLDALCEGLSGENPHDVTAPEYAAAYAWLERLTWRQAEQGLTPAETASFIASFKGALFECLQAEYADQPGVLNQEILRLSQLFDNLGIVFTETQATEHNAALEESRARARAITNYALDGLISMNEQGSITSYNPAAERIFGHTPAEVMDHNVKMLMPESSQHEYDGSLRNSVQTGAGQIIGQTREVVGQRKDGSTFPMDLALSEMSLRGHIEFIGIVRDISQRKQAEEEILRYTQELEEARTRMEAQAAALTKKTEELARSNAELDQFASIASHDLQEPLRKVLAFSDRLKTKYAAALDERGLDYLERMRSSTQRMQTLVKDLLNYARVTSKARRFVSVDLAVLTQEVVADLEVRIERTCGRVEVGDLPMLTADPTQLRQLLQNLIGNALKFHRPEVPPVVTVQVQPALAGTPAAYQLTIQDNGIGFEEEYREHIFAPFQRLHGSGEYEGTGIGLAVCRKIARRHGGDITVASAPGQGSTFTVTLPASPLEGETQLL